MEGWGQSLTSLPSSANGFVICSPGPGPGAVWIKTHFQGSVYYHFLQNSPFDQEPRDSTLCPRAACSHPREIPLLSPASQFESPVYFGNVASAPALALMSIEFNVFHCITEKLFQPHYQHFLDVPRGLFVAFCACGC